MYGIVTFIPLISFGQVGQLQSDKSLDKKIFAKKINEEIILDGEMTEDFWINAQSVSNFFQYQDFQKNFLLFGYFLLPH